MRVVVTGASGFLGRNVVYGLIEAGIDCVGVSRKYLPGLCVVDQYSKTPGGDVLIHLAETSDRSVVNASGDLLEVNARQTLESLLGKQFSRVIYCSSAVLYGDISVSPHVETDPVYANDVYTRIKLASERMVLEYGGSVARLSNLYGPGMARGTVLGTILGQLRQSGPLTVQTTSPVRDFLWIDDAAMALSRLAQTRTGGIFNVGSGVGTSIAELARTALDETGETGRPVVATQTDPQQSILVLEISKTAAALAWRPEVSLREGLHRLIHTSQ